MLEVFKALGDETRYELFKLIIKKNKDNKHVCACNIQCELCCSQSTLSHHLKVLTESKILIKSKEGKYNWYDINYEIMQEIVNSIEKHDRIDI